MVPHVESSNTHEMKIDYLFWGLYSKENQLEVSRLCTDKTLIDLKFASDTSSILYTYFTLGVYSPKKIEFTCGEAAHVKNN